MLFWIIQTTIISFILIYLVHHLFNFFKSTLTVPKIKDLVNAPTQKYESIFNVLSHHTDQNQNTSKIDNLFYKNAELLPKPQNDMKNELKNFLKEQLKTDSHSSSTDISALDSMSSQMYSQYSWSIENENEIEIDVIWKIYKGNVIYISKDKYVDWSR